MEREPYTEERPWGKFIQFTHNEPSTVKLLVVNPGEELSVQYHKGREEFWYALDGEGEITIGEKVVPLVPGTSYFAGKETPHSIRATKSIVRVLEISLGEFDEDDIVRLKDKYNRASP